MSGSRLTEVLDEALHYVPEHQGRLVLALGEAKQYHKDHPVHELVLDGRDAPPPTSGRPDRPDVFEATRDGTLKKMEDEHRQLTAQPLVKLGVPLPLALEIVDLFVL